MTNHKDEPEQIIPPSGSIAPIFIVFLTMLVIMTVFEAVKQVVFPNISIWDSHIATIIFSTVLATVAAAFALHRYQELLQQINRASEKRKQADQLQQETYAELEKRVKERTADLKIINEQLKQEIAERKQAEELLQKTKKKLEQSVDEHELELTQTTERLQLELLEHERTEKALRQQQTFLQQIIDINPHFIFAKDRQGLFTLANKAFANAYGTTVEELIGKNDANFNPNNKMVERYNRDDQEVIEMNKELIVPEHRIVNIHGRTLWRYTVKRPILDENGRAYQVLGVVTDITALKMAEQNLARALEQALEASHLKSQLLANVSHDLRTPLSAILGHTEMLQRGLYGLLTDKQLDIMQRILNNTNNLASMVNKLMDQAKLDADIMKLEITSFSPNDLIEHMQSAMKILAETKGLQLISHVDPALPSTIAGDLDRLHQIMLNLVGNAIKFTEKGSVQVNICQSNETHWAVQVTDTGPGIPDEAYIYIFEAFRQVDGTATRKHGGSGLGLSIVKQLTEMMDGEIRLESKLGQGSIFTIILPLTQP